MVTSMVVYVKQLKAYLKTCTILQLTKTMEATTSIILEIMPTSYHVPQIQQGQA